MKRFHLLVTGLCPEFLPLMPELLAGLRLANLRAILARGQVCREGGFRSASTALANLFAVDAVGIAPLTLRAEGIEPGDHWWLRADPVHLALARDHVVLRDRRSFGLSRVEADALVASLNAHFGGNPLFLAPHPQRWYARFDHRIDAEMPALDAVVGAPLAPGQGRGTDARWLERLGNEIQMLLHAHPLNETREARGEAPLNALWFWGGGRVQACVAGVDSVLAEDFVARALANAAGIPCASLPLRCQPRAYRVERLLVVLDRLDDAAAQGDIESWRARLQEIEDNWFSPLLTALWLGHVGELVIEAVGAQPFCVSLDRSAAWRLWRREHPICAGLSRRSV